MKNPSSRSRRRNFAITVAFLATVFGLMLGEGILRMHRAIIDGSDKLEPGLFSHHATLGWQGTPSFEGHHHHYDFDVVYRTDADGFRPVENTNMDGQLIAFLGDSFTFGLGVDNGETFVDRFAARLGSSGPFVVRNFAVPAYSTDQELLLLEERVLPQKPAVVFLCTYLGNDLADNPRTYPLHVNGAKPFFELSEGELRLRNTPVPRLSKSASAQRVTLGTVVLDGLSPELKPRATWIGRYEFACRLGFRQQSTPDLREHLRRTQRESIELYQALVTRARNAATDAGAEFVLILLAGHSFVNDTGSASAQYQNHLRLEILTWAKTSGLSIIDAAGLIKQAHDDGDDDLYHPHEGHLSPRGHQFVADLVLDWWKTARSAKGAT